MLHHSQTEGSHKLVLWGIANHHSDSGAWPSIATLAKYAKVSERRVQQIIRDLSRIGEIAIEEQGGLGQHQYKTNRYWILIQCPPDCDGSLNHKTGVKSGAVRDEIQDTLGVKPISPELNKELNKNLYTAISAKRAMRLPEDWEPSERLLGMFDTKWPNLDAALHTENFKLYWKASGKPMKDWEAAFQKWMNTEESRAKKFAKPKSEDTNWDELRRWAKEKDENEQR